MLAWEEEEEDDSGDVAASTLVEGEAGGAGAGASRPDSVSGIRVEIWTTEPAVQVYTGDGIAIAPSSSSSSPSSSSASSPESNPFQGYGPRAGIAVEPSRYVDAPSRPEWRGMVLLKKRGSTTGGEKECWGARNQWRVRYFPRPRTRPAREQEGEEGGRVRGGGGGRARWGGLILGH